MAILENGLESIELGATAWREILNYNFAKLLTKEQILALIQQGGANADGSVPSYLTKQEANSIYALKSELGNADLSQYLTLAAADSKYLSKLEANSFLTQQSADNYYAKKTELSGFATKDELSEIRVYNNNIKKGIDGLLSILESHKSWVRISEDDLTNINNIGACSVNERSLAFANVEGDQAFLYPQDIKKFKVYFDTRSVKAEISLVYQQNGDSILLVGNAEYGAGYKKTLNTTEYEDPGYSAFSSMDSTYFEIEILDDNMLLITALNSKNLLKTSEPLRLGICVNLKGSSDLTAGNLRVSKWV
ncbi:MAG: hypothetical protein MR782_07185 [Campylobacter sp.]|nr:hypothetical protein [Campylobacter sp.]